MTTRVFTRNSIDQTVKDKLYDVVNEALNVLREKYKNTFTPISYERAVFVVEQNETVRYYIDMFVQNRDKFYARRIYIDAIKQKSFNGIYKVSNVNVIITDDSEDLGVVPRPCISIFDEETDDCEKSRWEYSMPKKLNLMGKDINKIGDNVECIGYSFTDVKTSSPRCMWEDLRYRDIPVPRFNKK